MTILRITDSIGCQAPLGIEVFSNELNALPPNEAARRCAEATRVILDEARS